MTNAPRAKKEAPAEATPATPDYSVLAKTDNSDLDQFLASDSDEELVDARASRDADSREAELRDAPTWRPRASLPDPNPEPGWAFRWIRVGVGASKDKTNVDGRFREGWRPVSPEEQPEIAGTLVGGAKGEATIIIGDLMLCKAPAAMVKQRKAFYDAQSKSQEAGVRRKLLSVQDARMPLIRPQYQTSTSKSVF